MKVFLDVTSALQSPGTGMGGVGLALAKALTTHQTRSPSTIDLQLLSRKKKLVLSSNKLAADKPRAENNRSVAIGANYVSSIMTLSWANRIQGLGGAHIHSLDHQIPWVRQAKTSFLLHDLWTLFDNQFQDRKFQRRKAAHLKATLNRADRVVTLSQHVARQLVDYDPSFLNRVTVIPPGACQPEASFKVEAEEFSEEMLGFRRRGRPYFLCVGVFENRKNQTTLLRAFEKLDVAFDLVLVGSRHGHGAETVLKAVRQANLNLLKGRVFCFDHLPRGSLDALYEGAYALVQPSIDEGFGLPVLEALCRGKALCLSRVPSFFEISGGAALIFDALEQEELENHLEALAHSLDLKSELEAKSLKQARLWPTWAQVATKHVDFFRSF